MRTIYRALAGLVGAMLTLGGCSDGEGLMEPDYGAAEYGVPHARYHMSGRVLDQTNGAGLEGIEVIFHGDLADTTDAEGNWSLEGVSYYSGTTVTLNVNDIDGPLNGSYTDRLADVELEQTAPGSGDWEQGLFEEHGVDIELAEAPPRADDA